MSHAMNSHLGQGGLHRVGTLRGQAMAAAARTASAAMESTSQPEPEPELPPAFGSKAEDTKLVALLGNTPLFQRFPLEKRTELIRFFKMVTYNTGDEVFRQGDVGTTFFVIVEGTVEVKAVDLDEGAEAVVLEIHLGPGEMFGELAMHNNAPRGATITCLDPCKFLVMQKTEFDKHIKTEIAAMENEKGQYLAETPLFKVLTRAGASKDLIARLVYAFRVKYFAAHQFIAREGSTARNVFYLHSGEAVILKRAPQRSAGTTKPIRETDFNRSICTIQPPEGFGESVIFSDKYVESLRARTKCKVFFISREQLTRRLTPKQKAGLMEFAKRKLLWHYHRARQTVGSELVMPDSTVDICAPMTNLREVDKPHKITRSELGPTTPRASTANEPKKHADASPRPRPSSCQNFFFGSSPRKTKENGEEELKAGDMYKMLQNKGRKKRLKEINVQSRVLSSELYQPKAKHHTSRAEAIKAAREMAMADVFEIKKSFVQDRPDIEKDGMLAFLKFNGLSDQAAFNRSFLLRVQQTRHDNVRRGAAYPEFLLTPGPTEANLHFALNLRKTDLSVSVPKTGGLVTNRTLVNAVVKRERFVKRL